MSNIRQARRIKKWSGSDLGELMNVSKQTISHWENKRFEPSIKQLNKLSLLLEIPVEKIMKDFL